MGINPGSKYLGIAVVHGAFLWDARIKVLPGKGPKEKLPRLKVLFTRLFERYEPDVLVIKTLSPCRSSRQLNALTAKICTLAEKKGLRVYEYPLAELEKHFSPEKKINKRNLAEIAALHYPELLVELEKEKTAKHPYHIRLFEAVALATICAHKLDNH